MTTFGSLARLRAAVLPLAALLAIAAAPAHARSGGAPSCDDLWYERNALYKAGGYCFRTARAIRTFGNAGCSHDSTDDVPLSANDRRRIGDIQRIEGRQGCPR